MTSELIKRTPCLAEAQAQLDALPGSSDNLLANNIWHFEGPRKNIIIIDFNELKYLTAKYPDWALANTINWVLVTKQLWLSLDSVTGPQNYKNKIAGIKLFWSAMAQNNLSQLTKQNTKTVLTFLLMHGWREGKARRNLNIKSHGRFNDQTELQMYKAHLSILGLNLFARDVTESFITNSLREIIPKLTSNSQTYNDWRKGGSNDMLTLDHGQYYVEHCLTVFEKHYPMASALCSTNRAASELAQSTGYSKSTITLFLSLFLQGYSPGELHGRWRQWPITTLSNIYEAVNHHFISAYKIALYESELLKDECLIGFLSETQLNHTSENIDRMRVIVWHWHRGKNKKETIKLLNECQAPVSWKTFQNWLSAIMRQCAQEPCQLPTGQYYRTLGLISGETRNSAYTHPRQLMRLVSNAGITGIVALTGWRRSEYGFSVSSIIRTQNKDRLDQYAFPCRYEVDWYVFKTHGKIKQKREITFNILTMAERLQSLHDTDDEQPCLYTVTNHKKVPSDSTSKIQKSVRALWEHFVFNYPEFKLLDDWTAWQALQQKSECGNSLSQKERQNLKRLLEQKSASDWSNIAIDVNLKIAWQRTREEWPRLQFFLTKSSTKDKSSWLLKYRDGSLRQDVKTLLDKQLPNDTQTWLRSLPAEELTSSSLSRSIMDKIIEGTLYPTPHSFRHMWAEAVYRRFDGDAGWMIRSQFKHITPAMWLDYIIDKDNRTNHKAAKESVVSSLVQNYLRHNGEGYAGQLHTWLRRIIRKTSVALPEEQVEIVKHLTMVEIESIKANPWGYCLLKRRTREKAKCAEMSEPMRHNASPELCLGCMHNLMQTENVEWSLFHISSHVEALKNPIVPTVFKASSYTLVKNVTRHVRTLNPKHAALTELDTVLDNFKLRVT